MIDNKELGELYYLAGLEGAEVGEYVMGLLDFYEDFSSNESMSPVLKEALHTEILGWVEEFNTNYKVVSSTHPQPDIIIKSLVWAWD